MEILRKIYLINFKKVDWDNYLGYVVVADTEEEALKFAEVSPTKKTPWDNRFLENTEIEELGWTKKEKGVYLESYNAG